MKWEGLDTLYAALRKLPTELRDDAAAIIENAADRAYTAIYQEYGIKSGDLRSHLSIDPPSRTLYGASVLLKNTAHHAWLWDNGTEARHYTTSGGKRHATGQMWGKSAPPHTFVKHASKSRLLMYQELSDMITKHGLGVRGSAYDAA